MLHSHTLLYVVIYKCTHLNKSCVVTSHITEMVFVTKCIGKEYFVCDFKGHCVVVFNECGAFLRRIGCENLTNFPNGIDISDAGDVLVGDSHGNRFHVAVFNRSGEAICEFECPYVKVIFLF